MDYSPPGSAVHGILQARILEWVAISSSRGSSWPRDWTCLSYLSCIGRYSFDPWTTKIWTVWVHSYSDFFFSGKYVVGPLYLWALNPWIPQTTNGKFHPWLVEFTGAESIDTEGQLWNLNVCGFLYTWEAVEPTPCGYREMRVFAVSTDFTREMALK